MDMRSEQSSTGIPDEEGMGVSAFIHATASEAVTAVESRGEKALAVVVATSAQLAREAAMWRQSGAPIWTVKTINGQAIAALNIVSTQLHGTQITVTAQSISSETVLHAEYTSAATIFAPAAVQV